MENLAKAIIAVMKEVKGIDKTMTIGTGNSAYKGVSDQVVKQVIGEAMATHGLCIIPTKVTPKIQIDRWEGLDYGGKPAMKQSIFTEAITEYLLIHESGESMTVAGYGHGIDSQDKGAGKATTYALKYALLYLFLTPTGKIDDADSTHSEAIETPQKKQASATPSNGNSDAPKSPEKWLNKDTEQFTKAIEFLIGGGTMPKIREGYKVSKEVEMLLLKALEESAKKNVSA